MKKAARLALAAAQALKRFSFLGLAMTLILSSCTMEKRVYLSGYHIEWKKNKHISNGEILTDKDSIKEPSESQAMTEQVENPSPASENTSIDDENITASVEPKIIFPLKKNLTADSSYIKQQGKENPVHADDRKTNGMALTGFIMGCSSMLFLILEAAAFIGAFGLLASFCGIIAIVFSAIGWGKIRRNPEKFKGKGLAITGLICGILGLIIGVAAFINYIYWMTY